MLEHRPRRDRKPGPARPAHQLDRHDAVAAQLEEVVVDADPLDAQHLGEQPAQHRLRGVRGARCTRPDAELRLRQRTPVELAVRRQRQPLQHHKRRRHHVVRQRAAPAAARSCASIRGGSPPPRPPHSPPGAGAPARPSLAARPQPPAPHRGLPKQRRLDLARLDPEPAQLHLRVRAARRTPARRPRRHRARSPVRYIRAPRRAKRVRNKPLRRQPGRPR